MTRAGFLRDQSKHLFDVVTAGGLRYIDRGDYVPEAEPPKPKRQSKPCAKNDPKLVSAARELRDRYLEQINTTPLLSQGKYDVSRALEGKAIPMPETLAQIKPAPALPAPAPAPAPVAA